MEGNTIDKISKITDRGWATLVAAVAMLLWGVSGMTFVDIHEEGFKIRIAGEDAGLVTKLNPGTVEWVEPIFNNVYIYNSEMLKIAETLREE